MDLWSLVIIVAGFAFGYLAARWTYKESENILLTTLAFFFGYISIIIVTIIYLMVEGMPDWVHTGVQKFLYVKD